MQKNLKLVVSIGTILVFVGLGILSMNFINTKRELAFDTLNLSLSAASILDDNSESNTTTDEDTSEESVAPQASENQNYEYYIAKIEIPKIGLSRGFYDKNSSLNNVKWNIKVLKESSYPDVTNSNLILAAHSGNYSNSYFSNLYKLAKNDQAYIYYQNTKYTYKLTNIYNEKKDGDVEIRRNASKNTLTLITCTYNDDNHQTIYIFELIDKNSI